MGPFLVGSGPSFRPDPGDELGGKAAVDTARTDGPAHLPPGYIVPTGRSPNSL